MKAKNKINEIEEFQERTFEDIKHSDEFCEEYWLARELMLVVGYKSCDILKKLLTKQN